MIGLESREGLATLIDVELIEESEEKGVVIFHTRSFSVLCKPDIGTLDWEGWTTAVFQNLAHMNQSILPVTELHVSQRPAPIVQLPTPKMIVPPGMNFRG